MTVAVGGVITRHQTMGSGRAMRRTPRDKEISKHAARWRQSKSGQKIQRSKVRVRLPRVDRDVSSLSLLFRRYGVVFHSS